MVRNILLFLVIATLSAPAFAAEYKSAYDRVMATQTLRCAYNVYDPYFMKDPNTGQFSGIFYELTEAFGQSAGIKIEWTEEVPYNDIFSGLNANRYDALCSGMWPNVTRAKVGTFTIPIAYSIVTAWGRYDETRFSNLDKINDPAVKISTIDGEMSDMIAQGNFPLAERISSPGQTPFTDHFMKIISKKADVTFAEPSIVKEYISANPHTIKQLSTKPLRIFGNTLAVDKGEMELKEFLDVGLMELIYSGRVEAILKKYEKYPGSFMRVANPYEAAK